jgi:hypothetical protein
MGEAVAMTNLQVMAMARRLFGFFRCCASSSTHKLNRSSNRRESRRAASSFGGRPVSKWNATNLTSSSGRTCLKTRALEAAGASRRAESSSYGRPVSRSKGTNLLPLSDRNCLIWMAREEAGASSNVQLRAQYFSIAASALSRCCVLKGQNNPTRAVADQW